MNAIALLILLIGILYMSEYQGRLIISKLETFQAEAEMVSTALAEGATRTSTPVTLDIERAHQMGRSLSDTMGQRIRVFDHNGVLLSDSHKRQGPGGLIQISALEPPSSEMRSIQILKNMTGFFLGFLPDSSELPEYPNISSDQALEYPDANNALQGKISISAWRNQNANVFLSASAPIIKNEDQAGVILLTREAHDIESDLERVWFDIIRVFIISLIITVLLSIYLSGVIAQPLRRLAKAADKVRRGQANADDIPDLSKRHDDIGELSLILRDMTRALWDRMDAIERFAADVSHELKNPLTSLRSAIETASMVKKESDRKKMMDIIMHDLQRLDRLISDISHASRIDAELSRESFVKIDLADILRNLLDVYRDPLERRSETSDLRSLKVQAETVQIDLELPKAKSLDIFGSEGRLSQVFENLLSNALSFSPQNGNIFIEALVKDNHILIRLEDEGPGIPEGKLDSIFERFYSERPENEDYGNHSGLGLSICKQIIEAHQGRIFAENMSNPSGQVTGARFTVILNTL